MSTITAATSSERTSNPLRPHWLREVVGQERAKDLMSRAIGSCFARVEPLDHVLLVGPSGTGKTTFSHVIANELGVDCYDVEAPVSHDTLLELREVMQPGDILKIEEIHQQGMGDRRGRSGATTPETLYAVMEDRTIPTKDGLLPYPRICLIGTTTDEGLLPDAFINRFPLRPRLVPYTRDELEQITLANCRALKLRVTYRTLRLFAQASRGVPREINNFVKNAVLLTEPGGLCDGEQADEVLSINGIARDGLTPDMQAMLRFLYEKGGQTTGGELRYQASVGTIATAIGKSRDSKAVSLRIEPFLIEQGYLQVTHGGRRLTDAGIQRAKELT